MPGAHSMAWFDAGFIVEWANSVEQAKQCLNYKFDVLLLDTLGDRMAEIELAKKCKSKTPETKVVWVCKRPEVADEVITAATGEEVVAILRKIVGDG
jgi:DNA-binding NtrC family response regulator